MHVMCIFEYNQKHVFNQRFLNFIVCLFVCFFLNMRKFKHILKVSPSKKGDLESLQQ